MLFSRSGRLYSPPLCIRELRACTAEYLIPQKWPGIDILKSILSTSVSYCFISTIKFNRKVVHIEQKVFIHIPCEQYLPSFKKIRQQQMHSAKALCLSHMAG